MCKKTHLTPGFVGCKIRHKNIARNFQTVVGVDDDDGGGGDYVTLGSMDLVLTATVAVSLTRNCFNTFRYILSA